MKTIKTIAACTIEIDDKTALVLDAGQRVTFPAGLADLLISKGVADTRLSAPVKDHSIELGDIDPELFSEDGESVRAYLMAPASVRWHTPGKPADGWRV